MINDNEFRKQFRLEPIKGPEETYCPNCYNNPQNLRFLASETLNVHMPSIEDSLYNFAVWFSNPCEFCGDIIYGPQITIASEKKPSYYLWADNCHEAANHDNYWISWRGTRWEVIHFQEVTNVNYNHKGSSEVIEADLEWLDVHFLPYFCNDDSLSPPADCARRIAEKYLPALIRVNLWETAGQDLLYTPLPPISPEEKEALEKHLWDLSEEHRHIEDSKNPKDQKRSLEIAREMRNYLDNLPDDTTGDEYHLQQTAWWITSQLGDRDDYPEVYIGGRPY